MAIRMELPTAVHVRLRWTSIQARWRMRADRVKNYTNRTAAAPLAWWRGRAVLEADRSKEQSAALSGLLNEFENRYEDLVDLLCWAAKEGIQPGHVARYGALRSWMLRHYPSLQDNLRSHWMDTASPRQSDPFEALFTAITLQEVINSPTGIEAMMLTRSALESCREALNEVSR